VQDVRDDPLKTVKKTPPRLRNTALVTNGFIESEKLYRGIFESGGIPTVVLIEDSTISYINPEFERIIGYVRDEVEGKKRWTEFIAPEDLERMCEYQRKRRIDPKVVPSRYEFRVIRWDGQVRNGILSITLIPGTGKTVISLLDITDRVLAEDAVQKANKKLNFFSSITRYFLEVMDRAEHREHVRQLIGLGPPNNGSALAELFHDPEQGATIINRLTGVFVPEGYDPKADTIVQDVRPGSRVMTELRTAGIRNDILYRVIVTANPEGIPGFFPLFSGKTRDMGDDGRYRLTLEGDGVVANRESILPGISLDIIPPGQDAAGQYPHPDLYCHINLPKNPAVIDHIMQYLTAVR